MEKYLETDLRNKAGSVAYVGQLKIFVSNVNKEKIPTHPTLFGRHRHEYPTHPAMCTS